MDLEIFLELGGEDDLVVDDGEGDDALFELGWKVVLLEFVPGHQP